MGWEGMQLGTEQNVLEPGRALSLATAAAAAVRGLTEVKQPPSRRKNEPKINDAG